MASERFTVRLTRTAEKDLARLRGLSGRATRALLLLEHDPYRGHTLAGSLHGARALEFSMPGGAYRAAYIVILADHVCLVFMVGAHEGFYHQAERRYAALRRLGWDAPPSA